MKAKTLATFLAGLCALALAPPVGAQSVTRGPYLQIGTSTSIIVRWRTSEATDSRVRYGLTQGDLSNYVVNAATTTEHEVQLADLLPETTYYYAIGTSSQDLAGDDADHFFVTSPNPGSVRPSRIWVIGDSGTANANSEAVRDAYLGFIGEGAYTQAWLMLGDNAYSDGTDSEYQAAVFDTYPSILRQTVLWPTLGNHDGHSADSASQTGVYYDIFTLPPSAEAGGMASGTEAYYSFDYANIHFICLDSHDSDLNTTGPMLKWLVEDLAATTQNWIIAYWHHPPYSKGSHDSDSSGTLSTIRENVLPILESYGVDLVLCGHSHSYERSYQLHGHYGDSNTLDQTMIVDGGDGRADGIGAYIKDVIGAVYIVAGSSGKTSGGSLDHPVMFFSLNRLGSLVLDVDGNQLDATFINEVGVIEDYLTMLKGNLAPTVDAGPDQAVILPANASLHGTVSDDGEPSQSTLTTTWSYVSGPGSVEFGSVNLVDTTASFSTAGDYVLRLTANDGELAADDEVTVHVYPEGTTNQAPIVDAGPDTSTVLTAAVTLDGLVDDDGLPISPGTVTSTWSKVGGPGVVTFGDANAVDTTAIFSTDGTYDLRLSASDGDLNAWDEMTVTVDPAPLVVDVRVGASSDDAEESASGSVGLGSSDLELTQESTQQTVGMRFNGIAVPPGATVTSAWIQFQVDETDSQATSLTIQAEAADNPPTFSSSANISSRPRTVEAVQWSPPAWNTTGEAGPDQQTPDLSAVIQEVVNLSGWTSGNSLAVIITGTGKRVAEAYDGDSSGAPLLHIEFSTGPPGNQAPSVDAGPDQAVAPGADATLDGTVADDGLPEAATVITTWTRESGPGTVTFANASAAVTTASFSANGTYVLRLTADDSELVAWDEVTITVAPNQAPTVDAGLDQTVAPGVDAVLNGTVTDDGLPDPQALTTRWTAEDGPGIVTFADWTSADTAASFPTDGVYVLRLTANDSEFVVWDEVTITVDPNITVLTVPGDFSSIQAAHDAANSGDTILVDPGTYVGQITISKAITLASQYLTTGDESYIGTTILDGGGNAFVIEIPAGSEDRPTIHRTVKTASFPTPSSTSSTAWCGTRATGSTTKLAAEA
jgi:hypothetical protein